MQEFRRMFRMPWLGAVLLLTSFPANAQQGAAELDRLRVEQDHLRDEMERARANIATNYPQMAADMVGRIRMQEAAVSQERYRQATQVYEQDMAAHKAELERAAAAQAQYEAELRRAEEERARYEAEMAEYRRLYGDDK